jgi:hypothetical protein
MTWIVARPPGKNKSNLIAKDGHALPFAVEVLDTEPWSYNPGFPQDLPWDKKSPASAHDFALRTRFSHL